MSHSSRSQLREAVKPLLRGYSHAITAPLALLATIVLALMAAGDASRQVTVLIYGVTMILLFSGSALYHVGTWSQRTREALRRLDHSNIFLLIAGTYTPIAFAVLSGWQRTTVLGGVWGFSLVGIAIALTGVKLPRRVFVGLYLVVGWIALLAIPAIFARVGVAGGLLLVAGGALYSLGALCYALKRPQLWQNVFSYHEVFHLLVIAASAIFLVFIGTYVISLPPG